MGEESGELRTRSGGDDLRGGSDGEVEAQKCVAGVVEEEEEDGGDEDSDGEEGKQVGALGGGGELGAGPGCENEGDVVHDVKCVVEEQEGEAHGDWEGV